MPVWKDRLERWVCAKATCLDSVVGKLCRLEGSKSTLGLHFGTVNDGLVRSCDHAMSSKLVLEKPDTKVKVVR